MKKILLRIALALLTLIALSPLVLAAPKSGSKPRTVTKGSSFTARGSGSSSSSTGSHLTTGSGSNGYSHGHVKSGHSNGYATSGSSYSHGKSSLSIGHATSGHVASAYSHGHATGGSSYRHGKSSYSFGHSTGGSSYNFGKSGHGYDHAFSGSPYSYGKNGHSHSHSHGHSTGIAVGPYSSHHSPFRPMTTVAMGSIASSSVRVNGRGLVPMTTVGVVAASGSAQVMAPASVAVAPSGPVNGGIDAAESAYGAVMMQGVVALKEKRFTDAVVAFDEALKIKPGDATAIKGKRVALDAAIES